MANALAIAGVTAVLKDLLNDGLINADLDALGGFEVTVQPPERLATTDQADSINRLNLFLYRVTPNPGWVNERLPSRSSRGDRLTNPYLALDLHYLVSAYGVADLHAETLLGYALHLLHETPVLTRDEIRESLVPAVLDGAMLPSPFAQKDADALADQIEQIKVSPHTIDTEEMSRLWSSLNTGIRPSATYKVTVVLIESEASTRSAPPVKQRNLYVQPLNHPRIERLQSDADPGGPDSEFREGAIIVHGHRIALVGSGLRGAITEVRVGEASLPAAAVSVRDRRIEFDVPADLQPGIHGIQVLHRLEKEPPAVGLIPLETSNSAAVVLSPSLDPGPPPPIDLLSPDLGLLGPTDPVTGEVRVRFNHPVGAEQKAELLLNEVNAGPPSDRAAYAYVFAAKATAPGVTVVTQHDFAISSVERAIYLLRIRIDGTVSEVGVASGPGLPPNIAALSALDIYSDPVLDLSP
jgi:hypothetical protein